MSEQTVMAKLRPRERLFASVNRTETGRDTLIINLGKPFDSVTSKSGKEYPVSPPLHVASA